MRGALAALCLVCCAQPAPAPPRPVVAVCPGAPADGFRGAVDQIIPFDATRHQRQLLSAIICAGFRSGIEASMSQRAVNTKNRQVGGCRVGSDALNHARRVFAYGSFPHCGTESPSSYSPDLPLYRLPYDMQDAIRDAELEQAASAALHDASDAGREHDGDGALSRDAQKAAFYDGCLSVVSEQSHSAPVADEERREVQRACDEHWSYYH